MNKPYISSAWTSRSGISLLSLLETLEEYIILREKLAVLFAIIIWLYKAQRDRILVEFEASLLVPIYSWQAVSV